MFNRYVHQISPPSGESADKKRFSDYLETPNIVLLGDPGSGKSHLFREASNASVGGEFRSARAFLVIPPGELSEVLFIDALDEKRTGRVAADNTADLIVQKLYATKPKRVRISCRAQDWLGDTDLAVFGPYFDSHGGVVVLMLEPLTREEMHSILADHGVVSPDQFLEEAFSRELDDFLVNPQNLLMLADVVRDGKWPKTRRDLYEAATGLLLHEHNQAKSNAGEGVYSPHELRDAAGAICASRLIADVEGISLNESDDRPDFPSYRTIEFDDIGKVRAALGRRVFGAGHVENAVDYGHRTTAEYLAATWLSKKVRDGFPIGRLRALIGVDGYPASELRGLHAWLPVLLPEYLGQLVDADPFGVLTYGDAASLEPLGRRCLLDALGRLAEVDPWFRSSNWSARGLAALALPDMVGPFRTILQTEPKNFGLRSIVFDALAGGAPQKELEPDLTAALADEKLPYSERADAVVALLKMGDSSREAIVRCYRDIGRTGNEIRLRANILAVLYGIAFDKADVVALLIDSLNGANDLATGALWTLFDRIPFEDVPKILDQLDPKAAKARTDENWRNVSEVSYTFDRLLLRVLKEFPGPIEARKLSVWLQFRKEMHESDALGLTDEIKKELAPRKTEQRELTWNLLSGLRIDDQRLEHLYQLDELMLGTIDPDDSLEWYCEYLRDTNLEPAKEEFIYEIALQKSYRTSPLANEKFEWLWEFANQKPNLEAVRDQTAVVQISDLHRRHRETAARRAAERSDTRKRNRRAFEERQADIRNGSDENFLIWAAQIYFCLFADADPKVSPQQRLANELGETNAEIVIEGFRALLRNVNRFPALDKQIELRAENKRLSISYPIQAGLDEEWRSIANLTSIDDERLESAIAIDLLCPVPHYTNDRRNKRGWKDWLFTNRPNLVHRVYLAIARSEFARGGSFVEGLHELMTNEVLAQFKGTTVIQLLGEFPNAASQPLLQLLRGGFDAPEIRNNFIQVAEKVLQAADKLDPEQHDWWLIAAYIAAPAQHGPELQAKARRQKEVAWKIRDLIGFHQYTEKAPALKLSLEQLAAIASMIAYHFPSCDHPLGDVLHGNQNQWDASDFVRSLIGRIGTLLTAEATTALSKMLELREFDTYADYIKHTLANQRVLRRDTAYEQPDWTHTIGALFRGLPANVADLHALLVDQLRDVGKQISSANTDIYKRFWNEDSHGRIETPKPEESCRDVLVDMLRQCLRPLGVIVEPEGHMVGDKRADISVSLPGKKILVELKRDYHAEVWTAAEDQLDRFYTRDPDASGFGVYGVFWFGPRRGSSVPNPSNGLPTPESAVQMETTLKSILPEAKRARIAVVVFDVSEPFPKR